MNWKSTRIAIALAVATLLGCTPAREQSERQAEQPARPAQPQTLTVANRFEITEVTAASVKLTVLPARTRCAFLRWFNIPHDKSGGP